MTAVTTTPATPPRVDPDAPSVVACAGLSKVFKDFWLRNRVRAVHDINLNIHRGEVFGLLGPNGSGKSTTIKMILGLLRPTSGRVAVFGKHPEDVNIKKRIGYLPEESYLYRFLNARETLDYYGRLFHQDRNQRNKRIDMLLDMVGLTHAWRRPVGQYSKGMQRKIGLAQALINDPELLILDEPTTGMDPTATRQTKDLILELKRMGKTVLLCSHLLADVEDLCDRVVVMYGGTIQADGAIGDLLARKDETTLTTGTLPQQALDEIETILARYGTHLHNVAHPRQKLEAFFDDIVAKAQQRGDTTSGATAGGPIAGFLSGEAGTADQPESIIDQLARPQPAPADAAATAATTTDQAALEPEPPVEPQPDVSVIESLATGSGAAGSAAPSETIQASDTATASASPPESEPDLSVLDSLVTEPAQGGGASAPLSSTPTSPAEPAPELEPEPATAPEPERERELAHEPEPEPTPEPEPPRRDDVTSLGGDLASLYDKVPEYDGSEEAQGLIEDDDQPQSPHLGEDADDDEAPDEGFLRALTEVDPYDESDEVDDPAADEDEDPDPARPRH